MNGQEIPQRPTSAASSAAPSPSPSGPALPDQVSDVFDPQRWRVVEGFDFEDITYHRQVERDASGAVMRDLPTVRVAFDRPEVRNAFRPATVDELYRALDHARMTPEVGCILLTGNGPSPKDGGHSFCSGGDQRIRGRDGYRYVVTDPDGGTGSTGTSGPGSTGASGPGSTGASTSTGSNETIDPARAGRLHILEVQRLMRTTPKPVIAVVNGWAAGGGHSLHVVADLTIASKQHGKFKQTDATVGSFDAGYGSALLARQIGQKNARAVFFLAREHSAEQMVQMGAVNEAVDHERLEEVALEYAADINRQSPQAIRMLKFAFNMADDGLAGQQVFAGEATRMGYMTDEAVEGRDAFLQKRDPDWSAYPRYF
ncbi:1,4-dihydroxy-2-naphthoyl-CoA synthase [Citricoccus sp. GCM10030269]|uniref:1,4-dihydroxy-2-naphthoyl-CoA synthase n=1 Tax=Citricoccus sp. GCM10030269 TaxID=3273388 RepID=UPI003607833E